MTSKPDTLSFLLPDGSHAQYFFSYHSYKMYGQRNPSFDSTSGKILDFKDPDNSNHNNATGFFYERLSAFIRDELQWENSDGFYFAYVPPHNALATSPGMESFLKRLYNDFTVHNTENLLLRTKTIDKLATGGTRTQSIHEGSLSARPLARHIRGHKLLLCDDVATTGNSLQVCMNILSEFRPSGIIPIALSKTA